jgi:hypothetical protein
MVNPLYPTLEEEEEEFQDPEEQETPGPRLFYSQNTARDFFRQFNEILDNRDRTQEDAIRTLNANIVILTAAIERLAAGQQGPSPPPGGPPLIALRQLIPNDHNLVHRRSVVHREKDILHQRNCVSNQKKSVSNRRKYVRYQTYCLFDDPRPSSRTYVAGPM